MAESVVHKCFDGVEVLTEITVLAKGDTVEYIIPSFPVFGTRLTEVKLQYESNEEELMIFDGFARHCEALNHPLPASLCISNNYNSAFIIEVC